MRVSLAILFIVVSLATGCVRARGPAMGTELPNAHDPRLVHLAHQVAERPGDVSLRREYAAALWQTNLREQAIQELRKVYALVPADERSHLMLAGALMDAGRLDEARSVLDQAVTRWPASAAPHLLLGYLYRRHGQLQEAEIAFRKGLTRANTPRQRVSAHLGLGAVLERLGRQDEANEQYAWALSIYPELRGILKKVETERLWPKSIHTDAHYSWDEIAERLKRIEERLEKQAD